MLERDYIKPGRSVALGENGMAATSHPLATAAALDILRAGGNAMDAALAAVAVQSVVEPAMTGIGGDCFAIIAPAGKAPIAFNGSGRAPGGASADALRAQGMTQISPATAHAVTVPGTIDAWCQLSENHGRMGIERLLQPAVALAENGYRVTGRVALDWARYQSTVKADADAAVLYLPGDRPPRTGDRFAHPQLAQTLRRVAKEGRAGFYEGPVAEEIVTKLQSMGGVHSLDDFAGHAGDFVDPISAKFRGYDVLECPPNGQGLAALVMLRILDGFDLTDSAVSEADRVHLLAEASNAAYTLRDLLISDPTTMRVPVSEILSDSFITLLRGRISLDRVQPPAIWTEAVHRDTVYLTVVDRDRNVVSLINSLFNAFGSGILAPKSGVLLQNRGSGFSLLEGHPNELAPSKRPLHTIIPALMMKEGRPLMPFGVMGGQFQAVGHTHFLSHMLDRGFDPQRASEAPRSFAFNGALTMEEGFGDAVRADLERRGHTVAWASEPIGGCQAIYIDHERGLLVGSSDHRKDGLALGY